MIITPTKIDSAHSNTKNKQIDRHIPHWDLGSAGIIREIYFLCSLDSQLTHSGKELLSIVNIYLKTSLKCKIMEF